MKALVDVLNLDFYAHRFVTVDVGYNTGVAVTDRDRIEDTFILREKAVDKKRELTTRLLNMGSAFGKLLESLITPYNTIDLVLVEGVQIYASSESSMASASSGDLVGLSYLVGIYAQHASARGIETRIVLPRQWKGSMGKAIVKNRIKRATDLDYQEHVADAVGISLSFRGKL
jgi:hypothetical protein